MNMTMDVNINNMNNKQNTIMLCQANVLNSYVK